MVRRALVIRYRADTEKWTVIAVECEVRGWPEADADGETQFDNTHFDTEAEAWARLLREAEAWLSLGARRVKDLHKSLADVEKDLVDAALIRERLRQRESDPPRKPIRWGRGIDQVWHRWLPAPIGVTGTACGLTVGDYGGAWDPADDPADDPPLGSRICAACSAWRESRGTA